MAKPGSLEQHEELVRLAEQRVRRAVKKREIADAEETAAIRDLNAATKARADWIANNPDPQLMML